MGETLTVASFLNIQGSTCFFRLIIHALRLRTVDLFLYKVMWPRLTHAHERRSCERYLVPFVTALFANAAAGMRTYGFWEKRWTASSLVYLMKTPDTCFGVALDKGTIDNDALCLFICVLVTIVKNERLINCCCFFKEIFWSASSITYLWFQMKKVNGTNDKCK